jgi:glutamine amidotransferase
MCQLLGMNCSAPTDFRFSFRGFCTRGGHTDIHAHGFGVSIYEGKGLRTFLDSQPAAESPVAKLVSMYPIKTYNMMAHIRYATQGDVLLENVHPFQREMVSFVVLRRLVSVHLL